MNELKKVIEPSERIEWQGNPQANSYFVSKSITLLFLAGFAAVMLVLTKNQNPNLQLWICGVSALLIFLIVSMVLGYRATFYGVTNKRLIFQHGIIGRDFKSIDYDQIKSVSVNVGIIDKLFNTGSIMVFTGEVETFSSGSGRNRGSGVRSKFDNIENIANPYEILKKIQMHLTKRKENLYSGRA